MQISQWSKLVTCTNNSFMTCIWYHMKYGEQKFKHGQWGRHIPSFGRCFLLCGSNNILKCNECVCRGLAAKSCRYSLWRKHCCLQAIVRHVVERVGLREWTVYCTVCVISLFINDMQDDLVCTLRLFAGDALLYHKITHNDDTLAL